MSLIRKKPTEEEVELVVLRAAMLVRAREVDISGPAPGEEIEWLTSFAFDEFKRKPDARTMKLASLSVQALLTEKAFLDDVVQYEQLFPGAPIPGEFRERMLNAIRKVVDDFLSDQ